MNPAGVFLETNLFSKMLIYKSNIDGRNFLIPLTPEGSYLNRNEMHYFILTPEGSYKTAGTNIDVQHRWGWDHFIFCVAIKIEPRWGFSINQFIFKDVNL